MHARILSLFVAFTAMLAARAQTPTSLQPKPGEHIAIIGGAMADRMQHSGHFEALLHTKYPQHKLVVRNLAAAGDEVSFRHRSENFGSPDEWLTRVQADVVLAFFGYNEAFQGAAGIDKFKTDLGRWLGETKTRNYSGRGNPRIVLFSPTADERHRDSNYPDPTANNANLKLYAEAMAEVARANGVLFVDLYGPSLSLFNTAARGGQSLTVNGHFLTDEGDRLLAPVIFSGLIGEAPPAFDVSKLRAAVNEKNRQWHQRYRTVDGYNVYGGRSALAYQPGKGGFVSDRNAPTPHLSNYKVMQEEMTQRDVMTANRDRRVWNVAAGEDLVVTDSNLPPVTPVKTNKPGENPDESHKFLGGEEAIPKMTVHSGMRVNLFASEEQFPELINPVQMAWDTRGRLWVAVWPNYPERTPTSKVGDSLMIYEDTNGDGKADKSTQFLGDLNAPTGFQFYKDGVMVMQAPDYWYARDTDGDGKADWKERVLMGMDSADSHHTANAICLDPGGSMYLSDGVFHRTQVETAYGVVRNNDAAIYRFEPRTGKFETYIPYGFANPHGRVFDAWGNDIVTDATGNANYFGAAFSGRLDYPAKHPGMREFWARPSRPCPATGILTSRHFPEEFQGNFLNINVISFQGIYRVKVTEEGSGLKGETLENLISSTDPNFRPIAIATGPDGAIYFCDWHNPIIGHMQHHLRDPSRDKGHGRIYRITYEGRPLLRPAKIHGEPIPALLDLLKEPENQTRELAKIELDKHPTAAVLAALKQWIGRLDRNHPAYAHQMMEALWVQQWHNAVDAELLRSMLKSPDHRARAAAARVLCYWRDRVPDAMGLFRELAVDAHPRVRLEAVRAASFFPAAGAADMALLALKHPTDYYLDYTLRESLRQLDRHWRGAIADGTPVAADNPAGLEYLVRSVTTSELLKLPKVSGVQKAILLRADAPDADRAAALVALAEEQNVSRTKLLLDTLEGQSDPAVVGNLSRLLAFQLPEDLKASRVRIEGLTSKGSVAAVRSAAWAALAVADDSFDAVWARAGASASALTELIEGIPILLDPSFRAKAYDRVRPLLSGFPAGLEAALSSKTAPKGRYVRVELPRRGTLTLAEVQVMSGGKNIGPEGKASQSSTANGGEASRAVDGLTSGEFGRTGQTHTQENERNPWWELDLGTERPVESVTVWNRTDGNLGRRLEGFKLTVLDGQRRAVFTRAENPAPAPKLDVAVADDTAGSMRRAAVRAIVSMNHEPAAVFASLTDLIVRKDQVLVAAQGLRVVPRPVWPKDQAGRAANALVTWARSVPENARTAQEYVEAVQMADDLANFLPAADAATLRAGLKQLRVAVFVIRSVREQMRYDTPRIVVEAGKSFELIFENADFMPHNLAIVRPGTREALGTAAATMKPEALDAQGRAYLPDSPNILAATRLLEAGQRETLQVKAPEVVGDYEYVCTFPGHHQVMWGWLIVTRDVDAYLAAHPDVKLPSPLAAGEHENH